MISALLLLRVFWRKSLYGLLVPSRGMYVWRRKNLLPAAFAKMNKGGTGNAGHFAVGDYFYRVDHPHTNTGGNNMSFLIALALTVVIYLCASCCL